MKEESDDGEGFRLDVVVAASGFRQSDQQVLEEVGYSFSGVIALLIAWNLVYGEGKGWW